jgi:hypothetical protein
MALTFVCVKNHVSITHYVGRRPLGMLSSRGGRSSATSSRSLSSRMRRPAASLSGARENAGSNHTTTSTGGSNSTGFQIYQSPSAGQHGEAASVGDGESAEPEPSFWQHLGSELDKHKENRGVADKWTNVKVG